MPSLKKKTKRSYHHGDLKAALIASSLELVRERGPRGFTLNEASRRAGVSVSAPYNHFKDKDALLIEIVLLGNRVLLSEIRHAADACATSRDKMLAVYMAYIAFARKHPELFSVMFQSGIDKQSYPAVRIEAGKAFGFGHAIALELESSREKASELALALWTMAHGFAMLSGEKAIDQVTEANSGREALLLAQRLLK